MLPAMVSDARRRRSWPFGLWVLGREGESPKVLRLRMWILLVVTLVTANLVGAAVVIVLLNWVIPGVPLQNAVARTLLFVLVPTYIAVAILVELIWGARRLERSLRWLTEGRRPDPAEQVAALQGPVTLVRIQALMWAGAAIGFTVLEGIFSPRLILGVGATVVLAGTVTCAYTYLASEVLLRPVAARVLAFGLPETYRGPGVRTRAMLAWAVGSAVPVVGLMLVAITTLVEQDASATQISVSILAIGGITLVVGLLMAGIGARGTVDPIEDATRVVRAVEDGRLDAHTTIYDGSEIGRLQAGVNRMVDGLAERERLRDLFERHVGEEVAKAALERSAALGGELRDVAVLFVDIVESTQLSASESPAEVVRILNDFFAVVVDVVEALGGSVNKFEGDAALVVFGAPENLEDPCTSALHAARVLGRRLGRELDRCRAGIGVSSGRVVAGNIGAEHRYEYTVIGDAVNEAARLTELAKAEGSGSEALTLASAATVAAASAGESGCWRVLDDEVLLRGRANPTRLATPKR